MRFAIARPAWHRRDVTRILDPAVAPAVADACAAAARGHFLDAHRALARHFASRGPRWPLAAINRDALSSAVRMRYSSASIEACDRADRIVDGRFDLLGYQDLRLGNPPDSHADTAPSATVSPASESRFAAQPPEAPDPTTSASKEVFDCSPMHCLRHKRKDECEMVNSE